MDRELRKNPALLNDPNYVANHPELKSFMSAHPGIQHEVAEDPKRFMKAESKYDKKEDKAERKEEKVAVKEARQASKQHK